jgi:hypothetical protein
MPRTAAHPRSPKSVRMNPDAQKLLRLLAAYEDRTEGAIVEDALAVYLQYRSLSYSAALPEARDLNHAEPASVGDALERLTTAIEGALKAGQHAPVPGEGKTRLKKRLAAGA